MATATDRLNGVFSSLAVKAPCVAVAIANITLSGEQTVNGVAVTAGDRVLVTAQTDTTENGIYTVSTSAWSRAADFDGNRDIVKGTLVSVNRTTGADVFYQVTSANPITIGSSAISFIKIEDPNVNHPQTSEEVSAGVTPANTSYEALNAKRYGATGDSTTDDRGAFASGDLVGALVVPAGTYRIASNLTITNDIRFLPGAYLLPDSGITVTINGEVEANPGQPVFAGQGDVALSTTGRVYANWWIANGSSTTPNADFALRWNEMWANCANAREVFRVGIGTLASPVNQTGWNDAAVGPRLCHGGYGLLSVTHSDDVVLDTTDSAELTLVGWDVLTTTGNPKVGLLRARKTGDEGIGPFRCEDVRIRGNYSVATLLASMAERQSWLKCQFNNGDQNGSSQGYPARIITNEPVGNFSVASTFQTVTTTTVLSGNGNHFIDCSCQNDNGTTTTVTTGNVGATTIIRGDGGHIFTNDYQKSNGYSSYHIDTDSNGDVIGCKFERVWVEAQSAVNCDYTISVYGSGDAVDTCTDLYVDIFSDAPDVTSLLCTGVGRLNGLTFYGAHRSEGNVNHGVTITSSGAVDCHGGLIRLGFAGTVDLSGINDADSDLGLMVMIQDTSGDYVAPTSYGGQIFLNTSEQALATFTRNATVVEDYTLLASASATATNNNNVVAAIIAELQERGVIN